MVSATTVNVMTVKPATPKSVLVKKFRYVEDSQEYLKINYSKGYLLKNIYINSSGSGVVVIMEKY